MSSAENKAVFLSYASQDAEAARRICETLRSSGVEVWFDADGGLEHGDEWDAKIRKQIKECVLFIPLISANTQARHEGYFRIEWELAAERAMGIASGVAFILPIVIDSTREPDALVPDRFRKVQWTRLPGGVVTPDVQQRFLKLWSHRVGLVSHAANRSFVVGASLDDARGRGQAAPLQPKGRYWPWAAGALAAFLMGAGWWWSRSGTPKPVPVAAEPKVAAEAKSTPPLVTTSPVAPAASEKSLVVLPLENLSPDPENAYFTEGMHGDIILAVSRLSDLKVISRPSALHFKDSKASLPEIARLLGVAYVLTGSVRRAGNQVLIQLELRRASDEALLWSPTFKRELKDAISVQTEVATEVARLLHARQLIGTAASAKLYTTNPQAYDYFLKGFRLFYSGSYSIDEVCDLFSQAVKLDPGFVSAAGYLSATHTQGFRAESDSARRAFHAAEAKHWAEVSVGLSSEFGSGAMAFYLNYVVNDPEQALEYIQRALLVLPNDAAFHDVMGLVLGSLGRWPESLQSHKRAVELDPYNANNVGNLALALVRLRRTDEWEALCTKSLAVGVAGADRFSMARRRFELRGEMPDDPAAISIYGRMTWMGLTRRWEEYVSATETALANPRTDDRTRCALLSNQALGLRQLRRSADANKAGAAALAAAEKFAPGDSDQDRMLVIMARYIAGQTDEALAAARQYVDETMTRRDLRKRWGHELFLAELYARAGRTRESVALVKHLLEVPSYLTVPSLRSNPCWDNLRDDPEFEALLADPKNSAPL